MPDSRKARYMAECCQSTRSCSTKRPSSPYRRLHVRRGRARRALCTGKVECCQMPEAPSDTPQAPHRRHRNAAGPAISVAKLSRRGLLQGTARHQTPGHPSVLLQPGPCTSCTPMRSFFFPAYPLQRDSGFTVTTALWCALRSRTSF